MFAYFSLVGRTSGCLLFDNLLLRAPSHPLMLSASTYPTTIFFGFLPIFSYFFFSFLVLSALSLKFCQSATDALSLHTSYYSDIVLGFLPIFFYFFSFVSFVFEFCYIQPLIVSASTHPTTIFLGFLPIFCFLFSFCQLCLWFFASALSLHTSYYSNIFLGFLKPFSYFFLFKFGQLCLWIFLQWVLCRILPYVY